MFKDSGKQLMRFAEILYGILKVVIIIAAAISEVLLIISSKYVFKCFEVRGILLFFLELILIAGAAALAIFLSYIMSCCVYAFGQNNEELKFQSAMLEKVKEKLNGKESAEEPEPKPAPQPLKKICPNCGHENLTESVFCETCGQRLE